MDRGNDESREKIHLPPADESPARRRAAATIVGPRATSLGGTDPPSGSGVATYLSSPPRCVGDRGLR